jgi:protein-S-isoprenylcysteine O-methyltransferase Ste14
MIHAVAYRLIPILWLVWLLCWTAGAWRAKPTRWSESFASRLLHLVPLTLAALLLVLRRPWPGFLAQRFLVPSLGAALAGLLLVALGLGLALWARWYLGGNWSGVITLKENHTLIRSGPYRRLRHPIYTGLLLGFAGTALAIGEWRGVLALALVLPSFLRKIGVEEKNLFAAFPDYARYRSETSALIPFLW